MSSSIATTGSTTRSAWTRLDAVLLIGGAALLAVVLWASYALAQDTGEWLTRNTVRLSLAWYATALVSMMRLAPRDWDGTTPLGRFARWCWTWAIVVFLVHLAMAFHFYHGWSHAHAFAHTREVSGIGEGIYISYLFTALWTADALWWWVGPTSYASRARWVDRGLHGLMLFIVFNGMIVYESGAIRYAGLAMFATMAAVWFAARSRPRLARA